MQLQLNNGYRRRQEEPRTPEEGRGQGELLLVGLGTLIADLKGKTSCGVSFSNTCDDHVALIVESTREDFVSVPLKNLQALTSLSVPDSSCFVRTAS